MTCALKCACGAVNGTLDIGSNVNRVICYCRDCQAFAHYLKAAGRILDQHGGTNVIQVSPYRLHFVEGIEQLRCVQLKKSGMYRWFTNCCSTPVGNTLPNFRWSFIGMTHSIIELPADTSLDEHIGPVRKHVNTSGANGDLNVKASHPVLGFANILSQMLGLRLSGRYRHTPFFNVDGKPIAEPHVLADDEHEALYKTL